MSFSIPPTSSTSQATNTPGAPQVNDSYNSSQSSKSPLSIVHEESPASPRAQTPTEMAAAGSNIDLKLAEPENPSSTHHSTPASSIAGTPQSPRAPATSFPTTASSAPYMGMFTSPPSLSPPPHHSLPITSTPRFSTATTPNTIESATSIASESNPQSKGTNPPIENWQVLRDHIETLDKTIRHENQQYKEVNPSQYLLDIKAQDQEIFEKYGKDISTTEMWELLKSKQITVREYVDILHARTRKQKAVSIQRTRALAKEEYPSTGNTTPASSRSITPPPKRKRTATVTPEPPAHHFLEEKNLLNTGRVTDTPTSFTAKRPKMDNTSASSKDLSMEELKAENASLHQEVRRLQQQLEQEKALHEIKERALQQLLAVYQENWDLTHAKP